MATAESAEGIGKDPEQIEAEQPDEELFLEHLDQNTEPESESDLPSREELWQVVKAQQDQLDQQAQRIEELERKVEDVEFEATTIEEVADQLEAGKIGGEAGAEFVQQFIEVPESSALIDARCKKLFFQIIRENRVGTPVTSSDVVKWIGGLEESSNPSVQAKRIMERLAKHREDGFFLGDIELKKHRGKNCIWLGE